MTGHSYSAKVRLHMQVGSVTHELRRTSDTYVQMKKAVPFAVGTEAFVIVTVDDDPQVSHVRITEVENDWVKYERLNEHLDSGT